MRIIDLCVLWPWDEWNMCYLLQYIEWKPGRKFRSRILMDGSSVCTRDTMPRTAWETHIFRFIQVCVYLLFTRNSVLLSCMIRLFSTLFFMNDLVDYLRAWFIYFFCIRNSIISLIRSCACVPVVIPTYFYASKLRFRLYFYACKLRHRLYVNLDVGYSRICRLRRLG